jgi:hypothetical protein
MPMFPPLRNRFGVVVAGKEIYRAYEGDGSLPDFRLEWVEKIGLCFDLPAPIGQLGQVHIVLKVA